MSTGGRKKPVEAVYIATHKHDLRLTRICVASIRYWYPQIPIYLIKDELGGSFSTDEIEQSWNVGVFQTKARRFGWGFSKLEALFIPGGKRILILDADIVFVGRVLDILSEHDEDIVVHLEDQPPEPTGRFNELYFALPLLRAYDPDFRFLEYSFNTGQYVVTTGLLKREDFDGLIDSGSPRSVIRPEIFNRSDQGVLNYVVMKKHGRGALSVARIPFMVWNPDEMANFQIARITADSPYPKLIHWAGLRRRRMSSMPRADILHMFEDHYYSKIPLGKARRLGRLNKDRLANVRNRIVARFTRRHPFLYLT
jgi:hypothetical protein